MHLLITTSASAGFHAPYKGVIYLFIYFYLILRTVLGGRFPHYSHVADEETEVERDEAA